jgi:acetaldehyde dehydrogenase / alcohol dehydrogenase
MAALLKTPDAALEQARMMLEKARWAAARLQKLDRTTVLRIADAAAKAGHLKAQAYAEWAVRETGMGVVAHKKIKNEACSTGIVDLYRNEDFVAPRLHAERKIVEMPRPAGVIFALVPVTNPVATVFFKSLLALMTRNAIIISPHPLAKECCADAVRTLAEAAKAAGAPDGVIQVVAEPTIPRGQSRLPLRQSGNRRRPRQCRRGCR